MDKIFHNKGFMLWFDSKSVQPRVSATDVILAKSVFAHFAAQGSRSFVCLKNHFCCMFNETYWA